MVLVNANNDTKINNLLSTNQLEASQNMLFSYVYFSLVYVVAMKSAHVHIRALLVLEKLCLYNVSKLIVNEVH